MSCTDEVAGVRAPVASRIAAEASLQGWRTEIGGCPAVPENPIRMYGSRQWKSPFSDVYSSRYLRRLTREAQRTA